MNMLKPKIWQQITCKEDLMDEISSQLDVSSLTAQILVNRKMNSVGEAQEFLESDVKKLPSPFLFSGMKIGVNRLNQAIKNKEHILVFGDYDVDGITATALMYEMLNRLGAKVAYHIPERQTEGYGLNCQAVKRFSDQGIKLLITVDCGISSVKEVSLAAELGIDVIITDHHEPPAELPVALAIINPKLDKGKVFEHLAGVGVAFKLAQAVHLTYQLPAYQQIVGGEYLDLVALGTVADIVPIIAENRSLVKWGLKFIESTWRPGLRALIEESGLWGKELDTGDIGYGLAPKINAAGRVSSPLIALELLITEDETRGKQLAGLLAEENKKRQQVEQEIYIEVERLIKEEINLDEEKVIVLASEKWHSGVIGIVASKIVERYYRPTILIAIEQQKGKGSGRSISGFNLHQALDNCSELLLKYGGHKQAAGLSVNVENIMPFKKAINQFANQVLSSEDLDPIIKIDTQIKFSEITMKLTDELRLLAPFGFGNPKPVLSCENTNITNWNKVGKEQRHLKVTVSQEDVSHSGIGFNLAPYDKLVAATQSVSLAFGLEKNFWQGQEQLQLILKDLKPYFINSHKIKVATEFNILDARQIMNKKNYLNRFGNSKNLIYAYNYHIKQELEAQLEVSNSQSWEFVIANFSDSQLKQKVYDNIFLFQVPLNWNELQQLVDKSNNIHLCYAELPGDDVLEHKFPARKTIGQVYLILKNILGADTKNLMFRQLFGKIYQQIKLTPEDCQLVLTILKELNLLSIRSNEADQKFELCLLAEPDEKLDLYISQTYNKLMGQKGNYVYWASYWLYATRADIEETIFFPKEEITS